MEKNQTNLSVLRVLKTLQGLFLHGNRPIEITPEIEFAWSLALRSLSDQQIFSGLEKLITSWTSSYMPTPVQFKEYCIKENPNQTPEQAKEEAWLKLIGGSISTYDTNIFQDSNLVKAIKQSGGLDRILNAETGSIEQATIRRSFMACYDPQGERSKNPEDYRVIGFIERENKVQQGVPFGDTKYISFVGKWTEESKAKYKGSLLEYKPINLLRILERKEAVG